MRLLLYGLQASGASAAAMLAAQRPGSLALVDVPSYARTPAFGAGRDAIAKAVVSMTHSLADHVDSFRPDAVLFVVRDPLAQYASAAAKGFRDRDGRLEDKIAAFDALYADRSRHADAVIRHEDLAARDPDVAGTFAELSWRLPDDAFDLPRDRNAVLGALFDREPELFGRFDHGFGDARTEGGIGSAGIRTRRCERTDAAHVLALCPNLARVYGYDVPRSDPERPPGRR